MAYKSKTMSNSPHNERFVRKKTGITIVHVIKVNRCSYTDEYINAQSKSIDIANKRTMRLEEDDWNRDRQSLRSAVGWNETHSDMKNNVNCIMQLPFVKSCSISTDSERIVPIILREAMSFMFDKMSLFFAAESIIFFIFGLSNLLISVFYWLIGMFDVKFLINNINTVPFCLSLLFIGISIASWPLSGILNIVAIEIGKSKNKNNIYTIFGSLVALITLIVS